MSHSINHNQVDDLVKWIRIPSTTFTRLTTSANPIFALGNWTIDQFTGLMQSKTGYKPILDPAKFVRVHFMNRLGQVDDKELKKWAKYMSLGGERQTLAGFFQTDMTEIEKSKGQIIFTHHD